MPDVNPNLIWMIGATFIALSIGTSIRLIAIRHSTSDTARKRLGSLKVWWLLAILWSASVLIGQWGVGILLAVASMLALREYLPLVSSWKNIGHVTTAGLVILSLIHYGLVLTGWTQLSLVFLPIAALIWIGAIRSASSTPRDYIRITGGTYWGVMLMVYGLSHGLFLFQGQSIEPWAGPAGWFLFLIILTEMNDIMQAIVGRKWGRRKIAPAVSPNKSLEGLVGGMTSTAILAGLLAPYLTSLTHDRELLPGVAVSIAAGLLISTFGFLGDINMSAVKRDAGVKDGSSLFPGMGGVIDRIDSMTFTAPAFYYFVVLLDAMSGDGVY